MSQGKPRGVVAVLVSPQGRVVAEATDFSLGGSAGVSQQEAQRYRVKKAVAHEYLRGMVNGDLFAVLAAEFPGPERIVQKLVADHGYRLHFTDVGYPD